MNTKYIALISCLLVISLFGCKKNTPVIKFIVPADFKGVFVVKEDKVNGKLVDLSKDEITIIVTSDGKIHLNKTDFLYTRHKTVAEFDNGEEISYFSSSPDTEASLYMLVSRSKEGVYYLIGTQDNYDKVMKSFDISKLPLAKDINLKL